MAHAHGGGGGGSGGVFPGDGNPGEGHDARPMPGVFRHPPPHQVGGAGAVAVLLGLSARTPVGRLRPGITNAIAALTEMVTQGVVAFFGGVFMLAGIALALLLLDWRLALVPSAPIPPLLVVTSYLRRIMRESFRAVRL